MSYGIQITTPGFNYKTAGTQDFILNSAYKALKVNKVGSGTIDATGSETIDTDVEYQPIVFVYLGDSTDLRPYFCVGGLYEESFEWVMNDDDELIIYGSEGDVYAYVITWEYGGIYGTPTEYNPDENYGFKVSAAGDNVLDDNTPFADLIADSGLIMLKEKTSGYINVTSAPTSVSHDLGYRPVFYAYRSVTLDAETGYKPVEPEECHIDDSDLIFDINGEYFYIIYYDELA